VWELRIDVEPGYRVYYAQAGKTVVLLLCGGNIGHFHGVRILARLAAQQLEPGERAMKDRSHDDVMAEVFRNDPAYAVELLNSILEDDNQGELLIALRQMTKAFGGVPRIAERTHLNRTQLYRTLSANGNPEFSSLSAILKAMGLRLTVQRIQAPNAHA